MPLEQSEALILRTFAVGEQDKIVILFSQDKGIIKGVAKGARKFGNRFGSSLEPMSHVKIFYYEKEGHELVVINNCDLLESFFDLQHELDTSFTISYFAELIEEFSPAMAREDILFRLLLSVLKALEAGGDLEFLGAYFETWILKISGFLPDLQRCRKCRKEIKNGGWLSAKKDGVYCSDCSLYKKEKVAPGLSVFVQWIKKNPPTERKLTAGAEQIAPIRLTLQSIIVYHMEREPKSLRYLKR
jgi:DNA repair protein RecO (recombination protein O)